jgi:diphthine methyl ester synthase
MTLYLVGLGLYDHKDVSLRGLEIIKRADKVYLEHYTSILSVSKDALEDFYGRPVLLAPRVFVEQSADKELLLEAKNKDVVLLVVGDVFSATTHTDLFLRAKELNVPVNTIFNASVLTAVGITGLELYKFGKTTSVVFDDDNWLPITPYEVIKQNKDRGLHTLCLLDIKTAEPSKEDLLKQARGLEVDSQPPRFMTVNQALAILLKLESSQGEGLLSDDTLVVGVARLGHPDQLVVAGTIKEVSSFDFGEPLHSLIIPGKLHVVEEEALNLYFI